MSTMENVQGGLSKGNAPENVQGNVQDGKCPGGLSKENAPENVQGNVQIPMEDYKSLCAAFTTCDSLVNTQTDIQSASDRIYC